MVFSDETAVQFLRQNHIDHSERYSLFLMPIIGSALFLSSNRHYALQHRYANARTHSIRSRFCSHFITNFHSKQFHWIDLISELAGSESNCQRIVQRTFIVCHETTRWLEHWQSQAQADPQTRPAFPTSFTIRTKTNAKTNLIIHPSWPARRKLKSQHSRMGFRSILSARFSRNGFDIVFTFKSRKQENLFSRANLTVNLISSLRCFFFHSF